MACTPDFVLITKAYKQADLATAVGMCERSISNIELEKNPASLETVLRLAEYFKVHVEDIFHLDAEENQS